MPSLILLIITSLYCAPQLSHFYFIDYEFDLSPLLYIRENASFKMPGSFDAHGYPAKISTALMRIADDGAES